MSATNFFSFPITESDLQTICFKYFPFFIRFELTRNHFYQRMNIWYFLHYSLAKEFGHQNQLRCDINNQEFKICSNYFLCEFIKETVQLVECNVSNEIRSCKAMIVEIIKELGNDSNAENKVELLECKYFSEDDDAQTTSADHLIDRLQSFLIAFKKIKRSLKDWNVDISQLDLFTDCEYEIDYSKSRAFFLQNYPQIFKFEQSQSERVQYSNKFGLAQLYAHSSRSSDCELSSSSLDFSNLEQSSLNSSSQSLDASYMNSESTSDQNSLFGELEESIEYVMQIPFWDLVDNDLSPYLLSDLNKEIANYHSEIDRCTEAMNLKSFDTVSQLTLNQTKYHYFDPLDDYLLDHNSFHSSSAQQVISSLSPQNEPSLPIMEQLRQISEQIQNIEPEPQPYIPLQLKKLKKPIQKRTSESLSLLKPVQKQQEQQNQQKHHQQQQQQIMDSFQEQRLFKLLKSFDRDQARKLIEKLQLVEQQLPESFSKRRAQRIIKLLQQHSEQLPESLKSSQLPHLESIQNSINLNHNQAQKLTLLKQRSNQHLETMIHDENDFNRTSPQFKYSHSTRKRRNQSSSVILNLLRQKTLQRQKERENEERIQMQKETENRIQNQGQNKKQNQKKSQAKSQMKSQTKSQMKNQIKNQMKSQMPNQIQAQIQNRVKKQIQNQIQNKILTQSETQKKRQLNAQIKLERRESKRKR